MNQPPRFPIAHESPARTGAAQDRTLQRLGISYGLGLSLVSLLILEIINGGWLLVGAMWLLVLVGGAVFITLHRGALAAGDELLAARYLNRLHLMVSAIVLTMCLLGVVNLLFDAVDDAVSAWIAVLIGIGVIGASSCVVYLLTELSRKEA